MTAEAAQEKALELAKKHLKEEVAKRARRVRRTEARRAGKESQVSYEQSLDRAGEGDPEREYTRRRRAELLDRAVAEAKLGPRELEAWNAVRRRGLSLDAAAAELGCSKKALGQRLRRASRKIEAWLEQRGIDSIDDVA